MNLNHRKNCIKQIELKLTIIITCKKPKCFFDSIILQVSLQKNTSKNKIVKIINTHTKKDKCNIIKDKK